MKLPRKVIIAGREWPVIKNPKSIHAKGDWNPVSKITIGTKNKGRILDNFLHEVLENILFMNLHGYHNAIERWESGNMMFVLNHQQFEKVCSDLALAIKDIVKEK